MVCTGAAYPVYRDAGNCRAIRRAARGHRSLMMVAELCEREAYVTPGKSRQAFPHHDVDSYGDRRRWWVTLSRAMESAAYLGVPGNDFYWREVDNPTVVLARVSELEPETRLVHLRIIFQKSL